MVVYRLHYFKMQGRAESIRLAFKLAGVNYKEVTVEKPDWLRRKQELATQHVPVLEVDGKMIAESKTILRYVAREFGLHGKTSLETAYVDQVIDVAEDIWSPVNTLIRGTAEEKVAKIKRHLTEVVHPIYATLDRLLALEHAGDFFVGNSITVADIFFFSTADLVRNLSPTTPDVLEQYPKLLALKSRIAANPNIAAWLEVRPPEIVLIQ